MYHQVKSRFNETLKTSVCQTGLVLKTDSVMFYGLSFQKCSYEHFVYAFSVITLPSVHYDLHMS